MTPEPQDTSNAGEVPEQYAEGVEGADVRHLAAVNDEPEFDPSKPTTKEQAAKFAAAAGMPLPAGAAPDAGDGEQEGRSIEDLEADGAGQLPGFEQGALEGDPNLSLAKLTKGLPLQFEVKMMGGAVGLKGGLLNPKEHGRAMVVHEVAKIELVPQREGEPGEKRIIGWIVRQHLRPTYTEPLADALKDPGVTDAA